MSRPVLLVYIGFALLLPALARGADGWSQLKTGMTVDEASAVLGQPLLQTAARGFQLWIYPDRAEALFINGPLVAWTAPTPNPESAARPLGKDLTLLPGGILLRSRAIGPRSVLQPSYVYSPESRFRYSPRR